MPIALYLLGFRRLWLAHCCSPGIAELHQSPCQSPCSSPCGRACSDWPSSPLFDYLKRLSASISALDGISMKLASMAKDPETYSWKEYSTDLDRYGML